MSHQVHQNRNLGKVGMRCLYHCTLQLTALMLQDGGTYLAWRTTLNLFGLTQLLQSTDSYRCC